MFVICYLHLPYSFISLFGLFVVDSSSKPVVINIGRLEWALADSRPRPRLVPSRHYVFCGERRLDNELGERSDRSARLTSLFPLRIRKSWTQRWGQLARGRFFFCVFRDREEVEVHENAKRHFGYHPTILTERAWSIKDLIYCKTILLCPEWHVYLFWEPGKKANCICSTKTHKRNLCFLCFSAFCDSIVNIVKKLLLGYLW